VVALTPVGTLLSTVVIPLFVSLAVLAIGAHLDFTKRKTAAVAVILGAVAIPLCLVVDHLTKAPAPVTVVSAAPAPAPPPPPEIVYVAPPAPAAPGQPAPYLKARAKSFLSRSDGWFKSSLKAEHDAHEMNVRLHQEAPTMQKRQEAWDWMGKIDDTMRDGLILDWARKWMPESKTLKAELETSLGAARVRQLRRGKDAPNYGWAGNEFAIQEIINDVDTMASALPEEVPVRVGSN
jgi:hypothetical protein